MREYRFPIIIYLNNLEKYKKGKRYVGIHRTRYITIASNTLINFIRHANLYFILLKFKTGPQVIHVTNVQSTYL